jgi:hypothetical protein
MEVIGLKITWECQNCGAPQVTHGPAYSFRALANSIVKPKACPCGRKNVDVIAKLEQINYSVKEV